MLRASTRPRRWPQVELNIDRVAERSRPATAGYNPATPCGFRRQPVTPLSRWAAPALHQRGMTTDRHTHGHLPDPTTTGPATVSPLRGCELPRSTDDDHQQLSVSAAAATDGKITTTTIQAPAAEPPAHNACVDQLQLPVPALCQLYFSNIHFVLQLLVNCFFQEKLAFLLFSLKEKMASASFEFY